MIIGILQPMYLPWLGYFEQIASVDRFVLLDDAQYTKQDWRNRNRIKTVNGLRWLTVPVQRAPLTTAINEIRIDYSRNWVAKHLRTIEMNYHRCRFFEPLFGEISEVLSRRMIELSGLNRALIELLMSYLLIDTELSLASDVPRDPARYGPGVDRRNERLIEICQYFGASVFYEGASGVSYIDTERFGAAGVQTIFQDYRPVEYPQAFGEFVSHLSVLDVVMNTGPNAGDILRAPSVANPMLRRDCESVSSATC